MDIQLLNRWFKKGYTSREMAMFLLIADQAASTLKLQRPEAVAEKWEQLHNEVVKAIYQK